ncbi:MAG: sulfotransferase [Pseudomonadota bacterium]
MLRGALGRAPEGDDGAELPSEALARIAAMTRAAQADGPRLAMLAAPAPRSGSNFIEALALAGGGVAGAPLGLGEAGFLAAGGALDAYRRALAGRHAAAGALEAEAWLGFALAGFARAAARAAGPVPAQVVLLKDPRALGLTRAEAAAPDMRLILVIRDGRRTVDSALRTWRSAGPRRWLQRGPAELAAEWARGVDALLDLAERRAEALPVRYEAAASDPRAASDLLRAHLGLPPAPAGEAERAARLVRGSSTASRSGGAVDWTPRTRAEGFAPAVREVDWPARWERAYRREAARTEARLDATLPFRLPRKPEKAPRLAVA